MYIYLPLCKKEYETLINSVLSFSLRVSILIHARVTCTCHAAACVGVMHMEQVN